MLTDNPVLIRKHIPLPTLMCAQRKAAKRISIEEDFIRSNIESFGNEIGQTTNWITSMFEVRDKLERGSDEYRALSYRIDCGQLYQQNCIDRSKGIISKPMPRYWHDKHAVNKLDNEEQKALCRKIVADRKPYFMRYIYPDLMKKYNTYIKNTDKNALREFQKTVAELQISPLEELSEQERDFLQYFDYRMPVGLSNCVMNRICRRIEQEFDGCISKHSNDTEFDYRIMRNDAEYTTRQFNAIKHLYEEYNKKLHNYSVFADSERLDKIESSATLAAINEEFRAECDMICPDKNTLCNIILDICYTRSGTKRFAWSMCGKEIIHNLLSKNNNIISYPTPNEAGEIMYCGNRYTVESKYIEVDE